MTASTREEQRELILSHEQERARQLAYYVIDKPKPRVWMIFIPVFFVFYFWRLKEYEGGLQHFAEHHLIPRRRTLDAVFASLEHDRPIDFAALMSQNRHTDEKIQATHREWLELLARHFHLLLAARGGSYPQLVRAGYQNKTNYLLFCRRLVQAETAYNLALLPTIEGDAATIRQITETMSEGLDRLSKKEAEEIFS